MSLSVIEWTLGSLVIGCVGTFVGHYVREKNTVLEKTCQERRGSCINLVDVKIDNLVERFERMEILINDFVRDFKKG